MKKLFSLIFGTALFVLSSCGGGWSEEQKTTVKNECITMDGYDCDCYVEKATEIFKNPKEYNEKNPELKEKFEKAIEACEVEIEDTEEELESF